MTYIYALRDPSTEETRYIGVTNDLDGRLKAHISRARSHQTNHHCANWIRQLLGKGMTPEIAVVTVVQPDQDWQRVEADAIASALSAGCRLTNMTGGGDGFHQPHPDLLKKRGESRRRFLSDPINLAEHTRLMREAQSRPEVRAKRSESMKAAWNNPKTKAKLLGGMNRQDSVERRAAATRARMADPVALAAFKRRMREVANYARRPSAATESAG